MIEGQEEFSNLSPEMDAPPIRVSGKVWIQDITGPCIVAIVSVGGGEYLIQHLSISNRLEELKGLFNRSINQQISISSGQLNGQVTSLFNNGQKLNSMAEIKLRYGTAK